MFLSTCVIERRVVPTVEQWSPKPKVKGSNPFSPVSKTQSLLRRSPQALFESLRRIWSFFTRSCGAEQEMLRTPKDVVLQRRASKSSFGDTTFGGFLPIRARSSSCFQWLWTKQVVPLERISSKKEYSFLCFFLNGFGKVRSIPCPAPKERGPSPTELFE